MPIHVILTLPHPVDGLVNYALHLLKPHLAETERILCHSETGVLPMQRHIRNVLQGVASRRDKVRRVMASLDDLEARGGCIHLYNRFSLADFQIPCTEASVDRLAELLWLYLRDREPRISFVRYDHSLGSPAFFCGYQRYRGLMRAGEGADAAMTEAKRLTERWICDEDAIAARLRQGFGNEPVETVYVQSQLEPLPLASSLLNAMLHNLKESEASPPRDAVALTVRPLAKRIERMRPEIEALAGPVGPYKPATQSVRFMAGVRHANEPRLAHTCDVGTLVARDLLMHRDLS